MNPTHLSSEAAVAHAYGLTRETPESGTIERHLEECADCSGRVRSLRNDRESLAAAFRDEPAAATPLPPLRDPRRRKPWIESMAAALCLAAVGFGLFGTWRDRRPAGQAADPAVERDLRDLGSEDAATRERAFVRLKERSRELEPELRSALEQAQDPEIKTRLQVLLRPHDLARRGGLACGQPDGSLSIASPEGAAGFRIGQPAGDAKAHDLAWSPDGRWLAYRIGGDLLKPTTLQVVEIASAREHRVAVDALSRPVWSADSRAIFFATPSGLWKASGDRWNAAPIRNGGLPCAASADGSQLILWNPSRIERLDLATGEVRALAEAAGLAAPTADGSLYFFGTADGRVSYGVSAFPLQRLDLRSGAVSTVIGGATTGDSTPGNKNPLDRPAPSPRGDFVAWVRVTPEGRRVCLADPAGGKERILGTGTSPAWSADGTRIAFEAQGDQTIVLDIETTQKWVRVGGSPVWWPAPPGRNR